jgi:hypothetical protein
MKRRFGRLGLEGVAVAVVVVAMGVEVSQAAAAPLFAPASSYPVNGYPSYLATGDFNGDGSLDFAVTSYALEHVSVLLNNGSGGFGPETSYPAGSDPQSIAVGDFNGDGLPDLAIANFDKHTVSVMLNNGMGGFGPPTTYDLGAGAFPAAIAVGDLNGDGKPDIVTANTGEVGGVSVLLNNGSGSFAPAINYRVGQQLGGIALGDFNGDGKLDVAVTDDVANAVWVLLNNGSGGLGEVAGYGVPRQPGGIAVGDFNGDGKLDIATADDPSGTVSVLLNNGSGRFNAAVNYPVGAATPASVAIGDFNGDGKPDLVTANIGANTLSVLLNKVPASSAHRPNTKSVNSPNRRRGPRLEDRIGPDKRLGGPTDVHGPVHERRLEELRQHVQEPGRLRQLRRDRRQEPRWLARAPAARPCRSGVGSGEYSQGVTCAEHGQTTRRRPGTGRRCGRGCCALKRRLALCARCERLGQLRRCSCSGRGPSAPAEQRHTPASAGQRGSVVPVRGSAQARPFATRAMAPTTAAGSA